MTEQHAARRIYEDLAQQIVRWELPSGGRLSERDLSHRYGVSRTPVREALRLLEQAGLVEQTPPRGWAIRTYDLAAIEQIYAVRVALEDLAVTLAAGAVDTPEFEALQELTRAAGSSESPDPDGMREQFHERLAQLSGNVELVRILKEIDLRIQGCRRLDSAIPERAERAQQEHVEILELLAAGKVEAAQDVMRQHIERSQSTVRTLLNAGVTSLSFARQEAPGDDRSSPPGTGTPRAAGLRQR